MIWLATARALGLRVARSDEVYAASDGRGTLTIGAAATLDADDCLAQMIFHELCHSLVEGASAFGEPDWGLDNVSDADRPRELAALRVQAALADRHGLRRVLAPTTEHRPFYEALGDDPIAGDEAARAALARASTPPWHPHLEDALRRTRAIVTLAAPAARALDQDLLFATEDDDGC
ncbi:MAG: hypothetical protein KC503_25775 [Myxococcales bacterium]|nr:hypothetical protein [Myxococcales bacterium]